MCRLRRSSDTKPATGTKKENAKALTALGLFVHAIHSQIVLYSIARTAYWSAKELAIILQCCKPS